MGVNDYDLEPDNNTQINGINIAEGCPPSGINNAMRQLMADVKEDSDAQDTAIEALKKKAETPASAEELGPVKVGDGLTMGENGTLSANLATAEAAGRVKASTTAQAGTVPLGGDGGKINKSWFPDFIYNTREILTTSGTYSAPVTGWYRIELRGGGGGGGAGRALYGTTAIGGGGGSSGEIVQEYMYLTAGIEYSYTIGAGGSGGKVGVSSGIGESGGSTTFNGLTADGGSPGKQQTAGQIQDGYSGGSGGVNSYPNGGVSVLGGVGGGVGHGRGGDGGGGVVQTGGGEGSTAGKAGGQGCVILDYFDPDKENK